MYYKYITKKIMNNEKGGTIFIHIPAFLHYLSYKFSIFVFITKKLYHDSTNRNNTKTKETGISSNH